MNGFTEPLPGLLDDPQFQNIDLPALTDFQIAPLRNPAPLKHANVPLPLEPVTANAINGSRSTRSANHIDDKLVEKKRTPKITPSDVLLAREAKKPHLAISELLEDNDGSDLGPTQLPSFISLSVVEKSPIQEPTALQRLNPLKRPRLEQDMDYLTHDINRHLPRPAQKDGRQTRPAPLLPAMVTGLHEPPPSAALLPSMDLDLRPQMPRTMSSKMKLTDMLVTSSPPNSNSIITNITANDATAVPEHMSRAPSTPLDDTTTTSNSLLVLTSPVKEIKARRARRKWTDDETRHLLSGVRKHGVGKWKQILDDPDFKFVERSSVDLKDRYRVCLKDDNISLEFAPASAAAPPQLPLHYPSSNNASSTVVDDSSTPQDNPSAMADATSLASLQNKERRKRRAWTSAEDEALLKGVAKHGFQWTLIHDDPELDLSHRRATDLRDRIRNKFPDGYRHAESAPLRSEVKKAEKLNGSQSATPSGERMSVSSVASKGKLVEDLPSNEAAAKVGEPATNSNGLWRHEKDKEKEKERDQLGVTLPSLTLDDDDIDWDNRLPPVLLPWDDL